MPRLFWAPAWRGSISTALRSQLSASSNRPCSRTTIPRLLVAPADRGRASSAFRNAVSAPARSPRFQAAIAGSSATSRGGSARRRRKSQFSTTDSLVGTLAGAAVYSLGSVAWPSSDRASEHGYRECLWLDATGGRGPCGRLCAHGARARRPGGVPPPPPPPGGRFPHPPTPPPPPP